MLEITGKMCYNSIQNIRAANSTRQFFLLSGIEYTAIIYNARLVNLTAKLSKSLAAHLTNRAFFIGPYTTEKRTTYAWRQSCALRKVLL